MGELSDRHRECLTRLPLEKLEELGEALLDFQSRDDFEAWLRDRT
ncbi:MAG: DUF4351 domain-containing protein [Pseudanabaenaceae cyanobacterium]